MIQTIIEDAINDHLKFAEMTEPLNGENRQTKMPPYRSEKLNESRISNQTHYLHKSKKTLREDPLLTLNEIEVKIRDKTGKIIGFTRNLGPNVILLHDFNQNVRGRFEKTSNKVIDPQGNFVGFGIENLYSLLFKNANH